MHFLSQATSLSQRSGTEVTSVNEPSRAKLFLQCHQTSWALNLNSYKFVNLAMCENCLGPLFKIQVLALPSGGSDGSVSEAESLTSPEGGSDADVSGLGTTSLDSLHLSCLM